ncbi:MAG: hypothetical protein SFH39_00175 [Candidatus Magnetobacterium sp. LHC-1]
MRVVLSIINVTVIFVGLYYVIWAIRGLVETKRRSKVRSIVIVFVIDTEEGSWRLRASEYNMQPTKIELEMINFRLINQ